MPNIALIAGNLVSDSGVDISTANAQSYARLHSGRDFPNGTLIETTIDYSVTNGDPWVLEITGNSYGSLVPFNLTYQGYIYNNTTINVGGTSVGTNITGMSFFNYNGKLCFWFPYLSYWQGFNVYVYTALGGRKENRVTAISNVAKPAGITKEISMTFQQVVRTSSSTVGTTNYVSKFTGNGILADSQIFDNGTNVGIGTASPFSKFTISGTASTSQISIVNTEGGHFILRSGIPGVSNNGASFVIANVDGSNQNTRMVISAAGDVGVNTTSPAGKLDVVGASTYLGIGSSSDTFLFLRGYNGGLIRFQTNTGFSGTYNGLGITTNSNGVNSLPSWNFDFGGQDGVNFIADAFTIYRKPSGGSYTNLFTVLGTGNVGIGSSSPNRKLEVITGNGTTNGIRLTYGPNVTAEGFDITYLNNGSTTTSFDSLYSSDSAVMRFRMKTTGTAVTAMTILGSGNVGIGTVSPLAPLHVDRTVAGTVEADRTTPVDVLILESENTNQVEFTGFGQAIAFRGSTYNNSNQRTIGRILHQINDNSTDTTIGTSLDIQLLSNATGSNLASRFYIGGTGIITIPNLAGTGSRIVVADANGALSAATLSTSVVGGSGTVNRVAKFTATGTVGDSQIFDNGTNVGIGTVSPAAKLDIRGTSTQDIYLISTTTSNVENSIQSYFNNGGGWANFAVKSQNLIFYTGPSGGPQVERLYITSAGNVGVGTVSPGGSFHMANVSGAIFGSSAGSIGTLQLTSSSPVSPISGRLLFGTDGTGWQFRIAKNTLGSIVDLLILQDNGNLGLNVSNPGAPLHLIQNGGSVNSINIGLIVDYEATGAEQTGAGTAIRFRGRSGGGNIGNYDQAQIATNNVGSNNSHGLSFFYKPDAATALTEGFRLHSNGFVGIGTATPDSNLQVGSSGTSGGRTVRITDANYGLLLSGGAGPTNNYIQSLGTAIPLYFLSGNANNGNYVFSSTGRMGVGSTSPGGKVHIRQAASEVPLIIDSSSGTNSVFTQHQVNGSSGWETGMAGSGDSFKWFFSYGAFSAANAKVTITTGGNVGIGTTSPAGKLDVVDGLVYIRRQSVANDASHTLLRTEVGTDATLGTFYFQLNAFPSATGTNRYVEIYAGDSLAYRSITFPYGNIGIGTTSPSYRLDINGNTRVAGKLDINANDSFALNLTRSGTSAVAAQIYNNGGNNGWLLYGVESSTGGVIFPGSTAYAVVFGQYGNVPLEFFTNNTIRASISGAGVFRVHNLAGTGTRMVVVDASGNMSTQAIPGGSSGTVTSVALAVNSTGTDVAISGSPITTTGTLTISIPSANASARGVLTSTDWSTFNGKENAITAGTTAQYWRGDKSWQTLNTTAVVEGTNLYYTDARARASKSLTTTGTSGAATYNSTTGVLNIPQYQAALTNPVTGTGTTNTLVKFTGTTTVGNSGITDTGTAVTIASATTLSNLAGTGTRMVVADANGLLSTQAIPSGGGGGTGTVTSVGLSVNGSGSDISVSGSPITSSGSFTLSIPDAGPTARGVVNTGDQTFAGNKTFTGTTTLNSTRTALTNGAYGMYMLTTYNVTAAANNVNVYTSVDSLALNLTNGALTGNESFNVTANLNQVGIAGNAGTLSTQPIRGIISGVLGIPGAATMNIADFRYFEAKTPDRAALSGHIIQTIYGLKISQLRGATGFTITNGWGIYQEGSQDNNYFNGSVVIGSTTVGNYKLDVTNNFRVNTGTVPVAIESFVNSAVSGSAVASVYSTGSNSTIAFGSQANDTYLVGGFVFIGNQSAKFMVQGDTLAGAYDGWGSIGSSSKYMKEVYTNYLVDKVNFNRQTASYTLVSGDRSKVIEMNVASANTLTVPTNASVAFPIGTQITVVQYGAGQTTIAGAGVTFRSTNGWLKINARYGSATLVKVGTDEWYVIGNLSA